MGSLRRPGWVGLRDQVIRDRVQTVFDGYCRYFERALGEAAASGSIERSATRPAPPGHCRLLQSAMLLADFLTIGPSLGTRFPDIRLPDLLA